LFNRTWCSEDPVWFILAYQPPPANFMPNVSSRYLKYQYNFQLMSIP
jgi:hypothetical protein